MERTFERSRHEFCRVQVLGVRSHKLLAIALGGALVAARTAMAQPQILVAFCHREGIKLTRATLASPCLPLLKAACPTLDPRTQSHYAHIVNYGLATGLSGTQFRAVLETHGAVKIAKFERQRRAMREGKPAKSDNDEQLIAKFRQSRTPVSLRKITIPDPNDLALVVAGTVNGRLTAYAVDDDRARLLAALRHLNRLGVSKPVKSDPLADQGRKRMPRGKSEKENTAWRAKV